MTEMLQPGDVFLTRGSGFISKAIRFFTRTIGESRTRVNHVGIVVTEGAHREAFVVEALRKVFRHRLYDRYGGKQDEVAVYRPTNVSADDLQKIVARAEGYVGRKYGYFKILTHTLDWMLLGAYVFRRIGSDRYPICSWLVAHAYAEADLHFGVKAGAASPDDIWDFVTKRKDKYERVRELSSL